MMGIPRYVKHAIIPSECPPSGRHPNYTISSPHFTQNLFINVPKFPDHLQPVLPHHLRALNQRSHHPLIIPLQMKILPNPKSLSILPLPGFLHNLPRFRLRQLLPFLTNALCITLFYFPKMHINIYCIN